MSARTRWNPVPLDHIPLPAVAFDAADRLLGFNPPAAALFGLAPADAVGQSALILVPPDAVPDFHRAAAAARQAGRWEGELRVLGADGEERTTEVAWSFVGDRFVAVFKDVSARRAAADRTRQAATGSAVRRLAGAAAAELLRPGADPAAVAAQLQLLSDGPHPDDAVYRGNGHPVLLAADGPLLAAGLRGLLEAAGYAVLPADRGSAGDEFRRQRGRPLVAVFDLGTAAPAVAHDLWMVNPRLPVIAVDPQRGAVGWPPGPPHRRLARPVAPAAVLALVAQGFEDVLLNDSANV